MTPLSLDPPINSIFLCGIYLESVPVCDLYFCVWEVSGIKSKTYILILFYMYSVLKVSSFRNNSCWYYKE